MPPVPPLPLADLGTIVQAIIFLVFLGAGAVRMFTESKEVQEQEAKKTRRPQPNPREGEALQARGANADPQLGGPQESVRLEVEDFLRRAGQAPQEKPRPAKKIARKPQIELMEDDGGFDYQPRQASFSPQIKRTTVQRTTAPRQLSVRPQEGIDSGETVAEHVSSHLKRGKLAEHSSRLGEQVAQADERVEARLHQKFDHTLGDLPARRAQREAADKKRREKNETTSLAEELAAMLATPQGVRQAVILHEVLSRPADRW